MPRLDLNCDLGEGAGHDAELMPLVTSTNIACGAHAGDVATMRATVELALQHGVAIGAHPGFADRANFGRRELALSAAEIGRLVIEQTRALQEVARDCGGRVTHVKPHGALYNLAARDAAVARAIAAAVRACDPHLVLFGLAGSWSITAGREAGLRVASEVFADRTYQSDGTLTPRTQANALITDENAALAQVLLMVRERRVRAANGAVVSIEVDTVCLHGDGAHAVEFARRLRAELGAAGVEVASLARESRE
ncbi:MAG: LamB/YcsF family protein [Opitutus sp.]|nr:LamB/YcsF family protein [Opitutus sp.]